MIFMQDSHFQLTLSSTKSLRDMENSFEFSGIRIRMHTFQAWKASQGIKNLKILFSFVSKQFSIIMLLHRLQQGSPNSVTSTSLPPLPQET